MNLTVGSELRGLVDASGAGGVSKGATDTWSLVIHLVAWRTGPVVTKGKLRCEMPVSKDALKELMNEVEPYSTVDARIKGLATNGAALLESLEVFTGEDPELSRIRDDLLTPVRISTPDFGVLELDRRVDHYNGKAQWCGAEVRLSLSCADANEPGGALAAAASLFQDQAEWSKRVKEFAADRLLPVKNEYWLQDNEAELSREDFISRMTLEEISVDESGAFSFWHDDGDLFWVIQS